MIPQPIAAYLTAESNHNADAVVQCFTVDAIVQDDGKLHRGHDQIRKWNISTTDRYAAQMVPINVTKTENGYVLDASVSGNFPSSPANLKFHFVLNDSLITHLEVKV